MLKNLMIGKKLVIAFVIVTIIASSAGIVAMSIVKDVDKQYSDALINYGFSQGRIGISMTNLANIHTALYKAIGLADARQIEGANQELQEALTAYEASMGSISEILVSEQEIALHADILKQSPSLRTMVEAIAEKGKTTNPAMRVEAQTMAEDQLSPLYTSIYNEFLVLFEKTSQAGAALSAQLTQKSNSLLIFTTVLIAAAMLISIVFGLFIASSISRPITACTERLRKLANGDLSSPVPQITLKDETGILAQATETIVTNLNTIVADECYILDEMGSGNFVVKTRAEGGYVGDFAPLLQIIRKIRLSLSDTMANINQVADQVSSGSEQVAGGAQALSQGAVQQSASIQELLSTISEIHRQTQTNTANARIASERVDSAGESINDSNRQMQEMIAAISEISNTSGQIGKIIKTIEDIAFQTNILALNAAVEAARAGAAGKGFAVVADEVRSLAGKSGEAAKNTTALIENSLRAVENGTRIAHETAKSMNAVVEMAKEVTALVDDIATASVTQAESITAVTGGMDEISSVVQTNSATAQQSAAASEELFGQARVLKELVSRFKTTEESYLTQPALAEANRPRLM